MPFQTIADTNTRYALIAFDENGNERNPDPDGINGLLSQRILKDFAEAAPSHVFFFSHGWKGDVVSAIDQYDRWIGAMNKLPADIAAMGPNFKPYYIGLHWPSQAWGDEQLAGSASFGDAGPGLDSVRQHYNEILGNTPEINQQLDTLFNAQANNAAALMLPADVKDAYQKLAAIIGYTGSGPGSAPEAEGKPFDADAAFNAYNQVPANFADGGLADKLLSPLRQFTFWTMKSRGRTIGETGMHNFVAATQNALPNASIHLMGHSFGCVVMSSVLGGKGGQSPLPRQVDSLLLAQGALSLWAYSNHVNNNAGPGYFNSAFLRPAVRGPILVTRSANDKAVGMAYPLAVALLLTNADFAPDSPLVPESLPYYGGIGTFGIRGLSNLSDLQMLGATGSYTFEAGKIYNLKGDEFIPDHNGVDGPEVAHAHWQAVLSASSRKTLGAV